MNSFSYEEELVAPVALYFFKDGGIILREVRLGFCRADLMVFRPDQRVIAVELKLADWKKALVQAMNYQLGSDYVYIAFPEKKRRLVTEKLQKVLLERGIGLLYVDESTKKVDEAISPKRSSISFGTLSLKEMKKRRRSTHSVHRLF